MKKINSILMAALLAAASLFSFNSCGDDPLASLSVDATIIDQATGKVSLEQTLGKVAQLWLITTSGETNQSSTYQTYLDQLIKNGNTLITGLPEGTYEIRVFDGTNLNSANVAKKQFIISTTTNPPAIDWTNATGVITANGTYAYQRGSDIGTSNKTGQIVVSNLTTTTVTVNLDNKGNVNLGDATGLPSYLLQDGTSSTYAQLGGTSMTAATAATIFGGKKTGVALFGSPENLSISGATGLIRFVAVAQQ